MNPRVTTVCIRCLINLLGRRWYWVLLCRWLLAGTCLTFVGGKHRFGGGTLALKKGGGGLKVSLLCTVWHTGWGIHWY